MDPTCSRTLILIISWALTIESRQYLFRTFLKSLNSPARMLNYRSSWQLEGKPKMMLKTFLLQDLILMKVCQRAAATCPCSSPLNVFVPNRQHFFNRVIVCFWKLWKTDFLLPSSTLSAGISLSVVSNSKTWLVTSFSLNSNSL
jgi:hypothetical protein